eukprot:gene13751-52769_t
MTRSGRATGGRACIRHCEKQVPGLQKGEKPKRDVHYERREYIKRGDRVLNRPHMYESKDARNEWWP